MDVKGLKPKAIAINSRRQPTRLVSKNKHIQIWYKKLAYASNAQVVRAFKLTDGINLNIFDNNEYDSTKILIDSDNSDMLDFDSEVVDKKVLIVATATTVIATSQQFVNFMSKIALYQESKCKSRSTSKLLAGLL